jgi:hypothetical protein
MGASHGKTKKQQKEEARQWAETKDTEITTLYGENTKLINDMRLLQADIQTMKRTMEQQQRIIETMSKENAAMSRRFEEKLEEQQQRIIENMSKENAVIREIKSPRRVHFEDEDKRERGVCCCPTTQEAHNAELQRMFDEELELVLSSHAIVSAQVRYMPGGKLDWAMLDDKGLQAVGILQRYGGYRDTTIEEMRKRHDLQVKFNTEWFKFEGNHFKSVAKVLFVLRNGIASMPFHY